MTKIHYNFEYKKAYNESNSSKIKRKSKVKS
jgi:hypothetical protein